MKFWEQNSHIEVGEGNTDIESNNEKLRPYFLGRLSDSENDTFEEEIALDEDFFERARLAESELIDDYLRRDLSESDTEAFEANYLQSESRREKVASAAALWRVANEQQTKVLAPAAHSSRSLLEILSGWKVIAGFAVVLIGYGLVSMVLRSGTVAVEFGQLPGGSTTPGISIERIQEPEPGANAITSAAVNNANEDAVRVIITKPNSNRPASTGTHSSGIATFILTPGALRDEGEQSIKIPASTKTVDLRLSRPKDASKYPAYSVTLKTADGGMILFLPNVRSLHLRLPSNKLENRTYIVFLEGLTAAGASESIAEYTFRVRR